MIKEVFLVFSNVNTRRGQGLRYEIDPVEEGRLRMVVARLSEMFGPFGNVAVMAQYPTFAMATGQLLAEGFDQCINEVFVGLSGLSEEITRAGKLDTLFLPCLSFHDSIRGGDDVFHRVFIAWWNKHCPLFGMPSIPKHECDGERSVLLIDYHRRQVAWISNVGEAAEDHVLVTSQS